MKAAVLGTTGYTGGVLLRILNNHPEIDAVIPCTSSKMGQPLVEFDSGLGSIYKKADITDGKMISTQQALKLKPDVVFAALPHLKSAEIAAPFLPDSVIIDLSADFRIKDHSLFEKAYGQLPPRPDLLKQAVYGMADLYKEEIKTANLIANPGCYPTCTLLPLMPIVKKLTPVGSIITNAQSGVSGAGRKASENLIFCERSENMSAYLPGKSHRHVTEMEKELHKNNSDCDLIFTPHLVPLRRGMIATTILTVKESVKIDEIVKLLTDSYKNSPFVNIIGEKIPQSKDVWGTNRIDIGCQLINNHQIMLFSSIDNLYKGASGQAVHNMNIRFGFDEQAGLNGFGAV